MDLHLGRMFQLIWLFPLLLGLSNGFLVHSSHMHGHPTTISPSTLRQATQEEEQESENPFLTNLKMRFNIFQKSRANGDRIEQTLANVLAGEYDPDDVRSEIQSMIESNACVMFTWERSPSCVSAVKALDLAGARYKNVRLDDPWEKGNPIRAELGKMLGKSSVPCIFIGGDYVGGYDAGTSDDSPGLVALAFQGRLREKLERAGAL
jgi:glutaredoxin 3